VSLLFGFCQHLTAGGSGLNVLVVVNQASSNSCELGNYYCEKRQIPPANVLRINWTGGNISWSSNEFQLYLLSPLLDALSSRDLSSQIDYVVLSMDIPFQIMNGATINSTTAALFYGLKPDTHGSKGYGSSYAGSEAIFHEAKPNTDLGYSFLATMLTANSLADAKQLVDRAIAGDATFPAQDVILEKSSDPSRNIRYPMFDSAILNVQVLGRGAITRTNSDATPPNPLPRLGFQTGLPNYSVPTNSFVPGSMADSLTSYGGIIFGPNSQTTLLSFISAGAAGSYGTVAEPFGDSSRFPSPQNYFYQARGFSLAECYYQSIKTPFLGLIVGEPLAAPFAQPSFGKWLGLDTNAVLSGTVPLGLNFSTRKSPPLQQIDLFLDGKFYQTVTKVGPREGNVLTLNLNGLPVTWTVPANCSLSNVASGLAAALNDSAVANLARVQAIPYGDRIELHSLSTNIAAEPFYFVDSAATNGGSLFYRVRYLPYPSTPEVTPLGLDSAAGFRMHLETAPGVPFVVQASTNFLNWLPIATNLLGGEQDFFDADALVYPQRFYRAIAADTHPRLSLNLAAGGSRMALHVQSDTSVPYAVQVSTNLFDWFLFATNAGSADFLDLPVQAGGSGFYRALLQPALPAAAALTAQPSSSGTVLSVTGAVRPYVIEVSSDATQWSALFTNRVLTGGHVVASSLRGSADSLTTFLTVSSDFFVTSRASGTRTYYVSGNVDLGTWLGIQVTKTNGQQVCVSVTNQSAFGTVASLTQQLMDAINSEPLLQSPDGLVDEDFSADPFSPTFHLRAVGSGLAASSIGVVFSGSTNLSTWPPGNTTLNQNLADLQPRNHIYVNAGTNRLAANFSLDTTLLADGYHELTAVAGEGSSVNTQTRISTLIRVQNSQLSASMELLDLADPSPVSDFYHVKVDAGTNSVSSISLYSTGGVLASAINASSVTFIVDGAWLAAGLHPFYAIVQTSDGRQYRTETRWARLVNSP